MRLVVALGVLTSGCALLDNAELDGTVKLDPNRVYLPAKQWISVRDREEVALYACLSGPMSCVTTGMRWDCNCP
jgi:hypothetical protein